jgi:ssRNA-specific RNase YbeY (16S rRNA maturation enzyme)
MVKGRIGEVTCNLLPIKKNYREGHQGLSEEESTKILRVHSTLHLLSFNSKLIWELMVTEGNKQKGRAK